MEHSARITLQGDPHGMHARPIAEVARALQGIDAQVEFRRDGKRVPIRAVLTIIDLLQAACDLQLAHGTTFEITCGGHEGERAFEALRACFTSGVHFAGSEFVPLEPPRGEP